MSQSLESSIRQAYAAFGSGNLDGYLAVCTEDLYFSVPGDSGISGVYQGRHGMTDLALKAMSITAGTFQEEIEDVLVNDRHAVVLVRHRFTREGEAKDYQSAHVYEIRGGKLARCFEQPRDPAAFDEAWGPKLK